MECFKVSARVSPNKTQILDLTPLLAVLSVGSTTGGKSTSSMSKTASPSTSRNNVDNERKH